MIKLPANVQVYDGKGKALPTQIIEKNDGKLKFIFQAKLPSLGLAVFDVRETSQLPSTSHRFCLLPTARWKMPITRLL